MKKWIILLFIVCGFASSLWATNGTNQHMSPEEFRAKQQAFITEKAELTKQEAARFFPIYFELQDKKKDLNNKVWQLLREGKNEQTTEVRYGEILEGVYDTRIASDELEKAYFERFKKILSCKKIFLMQKAEMRFHRELLKGMNHKGEKGKK